MYSADILEEALRVLDERGWTKGKPEDVSGRVCTSRAISVAVTRLGLGSCSIGVSASRQLFEEAIGMYPIPSWNDSADTMFEDVRAKLKEAAQRARDLE